MSRVQILVDDQPAVTTAQAAQILGFTVAGLRAVISQNGIEPVGQIDGRTPLYDLGQLEAALQQRPGRGGRRAR